MITRLQQYAGSVRISLVLNHNVPSKTYFTNIATNNFGLITNLDCAKNNYYTMFMKEYNLNQDCKVRRLSC